MPAYSASFDCDDAAMMTCERLEGAGIRATAILGDLKTSGETYSECDHVWVLADIAGKQIAIDRGAIYLDRQHYEGYLITGRQLHEFVVQDLDVNGKAGENPGSR
jgi:hypothetical protein